MAEVRDLILREHHNIRFLSFTNLCFVKKGTQLLGILILFLCVGKECYTSCLFYSLRQLSLMPCTGTRHTPGQDLTSFCNIVFKNSDIFIIYIIYLVRTKSAKLFPLKSPLLQSCLPSLSSSQNGSKSVVSSGGTSAPSAPSAAVSS